MYVFFLFRVKFGVDWLCHSTKFKTNTFWSKNLSNCFVIVLHSKQTLFGQKNLSNCFVIVHNSKQTLFGQKKNCQIEVRSKISTNFD